MNKYDPTGTALIRRRFIADMRRRFRALKKAIRKLIIEEDAFGLVANSRTGAGVTAGGAVVLNTRFRFESNSEKVKSFLKWMKEQLATTLLQTTGAGEDETPWLGKYIRSTWKKAVVDAYNATHNTADKTLPFFKGKRSEFLERSFTGTIEANRVKELFTRTFEQLRGITESMSGTMARELSDGLSNGAGAREIARNLTKTVDKLERKRALTIARTEVVHSYAEGQLDSFEALAVPGLTVDAEWSTAGDDLVCPLCLPLHGVIMSVKEARGILPRHPNCRCAWKPAPVKNQRKKSDKVAKATKASVSAERKKGRLRDKKKKSTWPGADLF